MPLSVSSSIIVIVVAGVVTFATRLFPFAVFGSSKKMPKIISYLGDILPTAIIGALIIYCLRDFTTGDKNIIIPQLIAVGVTALVHLWKHNVLLSIAIGTIGYMILIHFVFI